MRRRTCQKSVVALVTAYALVLQALLSSFAFGSYTSQFGQKLFFELCQSKSAGSGSAAQDEPDKPADPRHMVCCVLCAAPSFHPATVAILPLDFPLSTQIAPAVPREASPGTFAVSGLPGRPRGPPQRFA